MAAESRSLDHIGPPADSKHQAIFKLLRIFLERMQDIEISSIPFQDKYFLKDTDYEWSNFFGEFFRPS